MNKLSLFLKASNRVLGVNHRNISYTLKYNKGASRRIADDKLRTKKVLQKHNIPAPKVLAKLKNDQDVDNFDFSNLNSFIIKPAKGTGGSGNLLIFSKSKKGDYWIGVNGKKYTEDNLKLYCKAILAGVFKLEFRKKPDIVIIEERVQIHSSLKRLSYKGLPDIRIILYKNIPVMAMLRLPTKKSEGKANLHMGGIAVGIDLATGKTTTAVQGTHFIDRHPDTKMLLSGFTIPYWKDVLKIAVKATSAVGLTFSAVDIVLDKERGPLVLELNTRPGLGIQLANLEGLKGRLEKLKGIKPKSLSHARKIGVNLFGGEVEDTVYEITGMQIVGFISYATFYSLDGEKVVKKVKVKNDSGALYTSIDLDLAYQLGFNKALEDFHKLGLDKHFKTKKEALNLKKKMQKFVENHPEIIGLSVVKSGNILTVRPKVKLFIEMEGLKVETIANISDRSNMIYKAIIGRRTLRKNFLIDTNKVFYRYKE